MPFVGPESVRKRLPVSSNSFANGLFHAITFERKVLSKIHDSKSKKSLRETREYRCLLVSTDAEAPTDRHTHSNPRACAPRVTMQLLPTTNRVVPGAVEAMSLTELTVQPKIRYAATVARSGNTRPPD